jgi:hypothetical protein
MQLAQDLIKQTDAIYLIFYLIFKIYRVTCYLTLYLMKSDNENFGARVYAPYYGSFFA